jgi:hypothetical protein
VKRMMAGAREDGKKLNNFFKEDKELKKLKN